MKRKYGTEVIYSDSDQDCESRKDKDTYRYSRGVKQLSVDNFKAFFLKLMCMKHILKIFLLMHFINFITEALNSHRLNIISSIFP